MNYGSLAAVLLGIFGMVGFCIVWAKIHTNQLKKFRENYNKLLNQKKSSEIRLGKIGENMAPFLKDWPWDPNKFHFIGYPTDGIQFNDDEIIFVEIKTGKSKLTSTQRRIRDIIKDKKVGFATFRIGESRTELKRVKEIEE